MNVEHACLILTALDLFLTQPEEKCKQSHPEYPQTRNKVIRNAEHQMEQFYTRMSNFQDYEYYLSDGGYSRIWVDPFKGVIYLTSNSRAEVKARWCLPRVLTLLAALKTAIEPEEGFYAKP